MPRHLKQVRAQEKGAILQVAPGAGRYFEKPNSLPPPLREHSVSLLLVDVS